MTGPAITEVEVELTFGATPLRTAGSGPPVLYLHGAHLPGRWLPLHSALAGHVALTVPVHPGYEHGDVPAWLFGIDDYVLHYRPLLGDGVHLVGDDLGAWLAALLAVTYPERVHSLTLLSPFGVRVAEAPPLDFFGAEPALYRQALFGSAVVASCFTDALAATDPADVAHRYGQNAVTARMIWERRYDVRLDTRLPLVQAPALVLAGGADSLTPPAHARRWAELLPGAVLQLIDGAPHQLSVTHPAECAAAIATFVASAQEEARP
jgi:pimeloyl-ACP methyl ester carboxylesterase